MPINQDEGGGFDRDADFSFDDGPGPGHGHGPPFRGRGGGPPWRMRGGPPRGHFDNGFPRGGMGPPRFRGGGRGFMGPPMRGGPPMHRMGGFGGPNHGPPMRFRGGGPPGGNGPPHFDGNHRGGGNFGGGPPPRFFDGGRGGGGGGMMHPDDNLWAETPTGDGKSYYYHTVTRETTWERPEGPGVRIILHTDWIGQENPEGQGMPNRMGDVNFDGDFSQESPPGTAMGGPHGMPGGPPFMQPLVEGGFPGGEQEPGFRGPGPLPSSPHGQGQGQGLSPSATPMLAPLHNLRQAAAANNPNPVERDVAIASTGQMGGLAKGAAPANGQGLENLAAATASALGLGTDEGQSQLNGMGQGQGGPRPMLNQLQLGQGQRPPGLSFTMGGPQAIGQGFAPFMGEVPPRQGGFPFNVPEGVGGPGPGQGQGQGGPYGMYAPPWGIPSAGGGGPISGVPPPVQYQMPNVNAMNPILGQIDPKILAAAQEWSEHTSPDGKVYYFSSKSQASVWDKPTALIELEGAKFVAQQRMNPLQQQQQAQALAALQVQQHIQQQQQAKKTELGAATLTSGKGVAAAGVKDPTKKPEAKKVGEKCRPISSTPIPGTPWCVVWTGDRRVFFYNPSNKQSVWDRPIELIGRMDVEEWTRNCPDGKGSSKVKKVEATSTTSPLTDPNASAASATAAAAAAATPTTATATAEGNSSTLPPPGTENSGDQEQPPKKRQKRSSSSTDPKNPDRPEPTVVTLDDDSDEDEKKQLKLKQVDAVEAETKAAKERAIIPVEDRLKQFKEMLIEKDVSAFSTWEKELHKIVFDSRYLLLNSKERKQAFEHYVKDRAEEERREKKNRLKQNKDTFIKFLKELNINSKMSYNEFAQKHGRDEKFKLIDKPRDREFIFAEYQSDLRRKEKEQRALQKEMNRDAFIELLKEKVKDHHVKFSDLKKKLESDPRFSGVDAEDREDIFYTFQKKLRQEAKNAEKTKKKDKKDKGKEKVDEKEKHRSSSGKDKDKERSRETAAPEDDMSESSSTKKEGDETTPASVISPEVQSEDEEGCLTDQGSSDEEEKLEREKKERAELSIRERERQVQRSMATHLRDRDKEREFHRHEEATREFQALLADLVRNIDLDWKDARRSMKKDKRWSAVSILSRDEMEDLFTVHCDAIAKKKKQRFKEMLSEAGVKLGSSWRDVRKKVKEDPRFEKFSSSDRKCEREFDLYLKELQTSIKNDYRELLMETKMLNYKSKVQVSENPGVLKDIVSMLSNDKRYHEMDSMADERSRLLLDFMDELERKGPPPPPTASEPARRNKT